jgi:hypothetical protein
MVTTTTYYNLEKPDGAALGDFVDVGIINTNMDDIDTALHNHDIQIAAAKPFVNLKRTAALTLTTGVNTLIPWDTETEDTNGFHAVNATDLVVPAGMGGIYSLAGYAAFQGGTINTIRACFASLNNAIIISNNAMTPGLLGLQPCLPIAAIWRLVPGDIINITVSQSSGGNLNVSSAYLQLAKIGV